MSGVSKHFGKAARAPGSERASESGKLDGDLLAGRLPARVESFLSRWRDLGQVNREGVGYATIQDVLLGGLGIAAPTRIALGLQACGDIRQPWFRLIRRYLLSLALYGATLGVLSAPLPKQFSRGLDRDFLLADSVALSVGPYASIDGKA